MVSSNVTCGLVLTTAVLIGFCTAKTAMFGTDYFNGETGANENEVVETGDKEGDNVGDIYNEEHIRHTYCIRKTHELERLLNESRAETEDLRKQLRQKEQAQRQSSDSTNSADHIFDFFWIIPGCLFLAAL